jgi:hypothetical protein
VASTAQRSVPTGTSVLRGVAALAGLALGTMFALGLVNQARIGFDLWSASSVVSTGAWAFFIGWFALAGDRPEIRRRLAAGLVCATVGAGVGVLATALIAPRLAPGSETAPVLVAIHVVPAAATLGMLVGWCLPRRRGRSPTPI